LEKVLYQDCLEVSTDNIPEQVTVKMLCSC